MKPPEKGWEDELKAVMLRHFTYEEIHAIVTSALSQQKREIQNNIGNLRQWINEKPADLLVTNEMIETWLFPKP